MNCNMNRFANNMFGWTGAISSMFYLKIVSSQWTPKIRLSCTTVGLLDIQK